MKILKILLRVLCSAHLWLVIYLAYLLHLLFMGIGDTIPARVWKLETALALSGVFLFLVAFAYRAGRESREPGIRRMKRHGEQVAIAYRRMLDTNKTMIDDVLLAHHAGLPVKTFLHGCGMSPPADEPADRSPRFEL